MYYHHAPIATAYIGIGSNIDSEQNLNAAAKLLKEKFTSIQFSSVYQSKAREVEDQNDFLNAVAKIETDQAPEEVHTFLLSIEQQLGKSPPFRYGPRTIDLDLLLYDDLAIETPGLTIPHSRMQERRFVLEPLCELTNLESEHPVLHKTWKELLQKTLNQDCSYLKKMEDIRHKT